MNNKFLLLILLLLLGIYGLSKVFSGTKDRSFDADLIQVDTAAVNSLILNTKADNYETVKLQKEGDQWLITKGNFTTKAQVLAVKNMLNNLNQIKAKRIVAKNPEKWKDYEVEDGKGSRIQVFEKGKLKEDFLLGRFNFNQQARTATSYIRLNNENEVYAIDGMASMNLAQNFDAFRNKQILKINKDDVTSIQFENETPENSFNLSRNGSGWSLGDTPADSTKTTQFISTLSSIMGSEFINNFDELKSKDLAFKQLKITANNQIEPEIITCYRDESLAKPFIIHSNQNKDAYFASDSTGVFARLFKNMGDFIE